MSEDIKEAYKEDTIGRRYHVPIVSKGSAFRDQPASDAISVSLNRPMDRDEFKRLSDSLKITYIKNLRDQYGATLSQVAEMLGYNQAHFSSKVISRLGLKGLFKKGGRVSAKQKSEWKKFLKQVQNEESAAKPTLKTEEPSLTMFCNCSFTLRGELKAKDIADRIRAMVEDGTQCSISVVINALEENTTLNEKEKGW